jgi:hypothetical protein
VVVACQFQQGSGLVQRHVREQFQRNASTCSTRTPAPWSHPIPYFHLLHLGHLPDRRGVFHRVQRCPCLVFSSSSPVFLASDPSLDIIVPACQLQIALGCSIHSRETTFKKLRHLIGPGVLVIPWLITIQF